MRFPAPAKPAVYARLVAAGRGRTRPPLAVGVVVAISCTVAETLLARILAGVASAQAVSMVYVPGIVVVASLWGVRLGLLTALTSALAVDYYFLPPIGSLRIATATDIAALAIFLAVTVLTCLFSALIRSLVAEIDARRNAELTAELARLLLRGPDLGSALPMAEQRLQEVLGLPCVSIALGTTQADEGRRILRLRDDTTSGILIVPADLATSVLCRLREEVLPSLEVLLEAAQERERNIQALKASRARVVAAADATRRRIGRDLHNGAQQRLITVLLTIRELQAMPPHRSDILQRELAGMAQLLNEAFTELHDISRNLHSPVLARGGIQPALAALARRCPIAVNLNVSIRRRLPERLEAAVYYITCEALTNVAKHAHASQVNIDLESNGHARLAIHDNGIGGADPSSGSGLAGLADRIEALDGTMQIVSPARGGTELLIELPVHSSR